MGDELRVPSLVGESFFTNLILHNGDRALQNVAVRCAQPGRNGLR
jgi:hypothetical protein